MNKLLIKKMAILSLILGFSLGLFCIIPYINLISFLLVFLFAAVGIIIYMTQKGLLGKLNSKEAAVHGGIIGFLAFAGYSVSMLPLAILVSTINNLWFHKMVWTSAVIVWFKIGIVAGTISLLLILIFIALLSAMMNAFSAMATVYVYDILLAHKQENENDNIGFDIKIDD